VLRQIVRDALADERALTPIARSEAVVLDPLEPVHEAHVIHGEPGLLAKLAQSRLLERLALIHTALRKLPERAARQT
jgi:hypothetical protein